MAYISNEIINEIRNKTDIVDVVSRYVNLTKKGKNYIGVCPFHDDHSPSMSVSPEKQIFTCFSCGASGNVFTFVSDFEKISFSDAVKLLGEKAGISIGNNTYIGNSKRDEYFDIYDNANKFYQNSLFTNLGKNAIQYLKNRNIEKINKFSTMNNELAYTIMNKLLEFEDVIISAARNGYPHLVANYLYELASLFHSYYAAEKIVTDDDIYTSERIALLAAIKIVINNAANMLGLILREEM